MDETPRDPIIERFAYLDVPPDVRPIAMPFAMLAGWLCAATRPGPARLEALHRLIEARDAAIRAYRASEPTPK